MKKVEINNEEEKKKNRKVIIIVVCVILGLLIYAAPICIAVFGIFASSTGADYEIKDDKVLISDEATIYDMKSLYDEVNNCYVIEGYIDNDSLDYVSIEFELYDINGVVIGKTFADISDMKKDTKYKFKAPYCEYDNADVAGYRIVNISDYLF